MLSHPQPFSTEHAEYGECVQGPGNSTVKGGGDKGKIEGGREREGRKERLRGRESERKTEKGGMREREGEGRED